MLYSFFCETQKMTDRAHFISPFNESGGLFIQPSLKIDKKVYASRCVCVKAFLLLQVDISSSPSHVALAKHLMVFLPIR